jgi:Diguanylate cyclase, GGDEF domain
MTDTADPIACDLFEFAPISLWEEDYSGVKAYLDQLRAAGVTDLRAYLAAQPQAVADCMARIQVLNINRKTVELFRAGSKRELLDNLQRVFRDEMRAHFRTELVHLWEGRLSDEVEGINYALNGEPVNIQLQWAVLPGSETSLEHVLISLEDITARKKAEDYLKYLGTHDVLTGRYNRAYFEDELARLGRGRQFPISLIVADVDGLKAVNDSRGHSEGDKLIRRAAEVLQASVRAGHRQQAAPRSRPGGQEFVQAGQRPLALQQPRAGFQLRGQRRAFPGDHALAPLALGLIQALVGVLEQRLGRWAVLGQGGQPDAQGQGQRRLAGKRPGAHGLQHALGGNQRARPVGVG